MKNNKKADIGLLTSILYDIESILNPNLVTSSVSTGTITMSDIKRDGADQKDIHRLIKNNILDSQNQPQLKIISLFQENSNLLKVLSEHINQDITPLLQNLNSNENLKQLGNIIYDYLSTIEKFADGGQFDRNDNFIEIKLADKEFEVLVAQTEEEKEKGLRDVEAMELDEGMLFDYSNDPQSDLSFWMFGTDIPLDVIFIGNDNTVLSVHKGQPNSEDFMTEEGPVKYVVELNQNSGIKVGDKLIIEGEKEDYDDGNMHVIGSDGQTQMVIEGGERIFSIKSTKKLVSLAKKAYESQLDEDYKKLGAYLFNELTAQDSREPEYV